MTTLNISLPDPLKQYVEKQAEDGGYSSSSEYVRGLIRCDKQKRTQANLESKMLEGLASGASAEMTKADWSDLRRKVKRAHSRRKQA